MKASASCFTQAALRIRVTQPALSAGIAELAAGLLWVEDRSAIVPGVSTLFTGRPARGIVNRVMRELGPMNPVAPAFPLAGAAMAPLRAHWEAKGSGDFSPLWSGQNASGCRDLPAAEITRSLIEGFSARA